MLIITFYVFFDQAADQTRMMQDQMQMQMPPDPSKAFKVPTSCIIIGLLPLS